MAEKVILAADVQPALNNLRKVVVIMASQLPSSITILSSSHIH
jgi:hypothetical protein